MPPFLYQFFHNETNDRTEKGQVNIPKDKSKWPDDWKRIVYKRYTILRPVRLPLVESSFLKLLYKRRSSVDNSSTGAVSLHVLSAILKCGYGMLGAGESERRTVPSAGRRYPLEIYPVLFRDIEGCKAGIYHYGIQKHVLEPMTLETFTRAELLSLTKQDWLADMTGMICLTAVFSRTTQKYGSRGYRYILLEAGHVAQNMVIAAAENGASMAPIGGINEIDIERKMKLGDSNERIVYVLYF